MTTIRPTTRADITGIANVLDATELFPSDMLDDMVEDYLGNPEPVDLWLTCESGGFICGFCYAVPEALTEGTWNMLAIAVDPEHQSRGCGKAIVGNLENLLRQKGARLLIADTSGTGEFAGTRAFYKAAGYQQESRIRDYWTAGDDKITFTKSLGQ